MSLHILSTHIIQTFQHCVQIRIIRRCAQSVELLTAKGFSDWPRAILATWTRPMICHGNTARMTSEPGHVMTQFGCQIYIYTNDNVCYSEYSFLHAICTKIHCEYLHWTSRLLFSFATEELVLMSNANTINDTIWLRYKVLSS